MIKEQEVAKATQEGHLIIAQMKFWYRSAMFKINDRRQFLHNFSKNGKHFFLYKHTAQQPGLLWSRPLPPPPILTIPAGNQQLLYLWNVLFELYKSLQPFLHSANKNCQVQSFLWFNIIQVLLLPPPLLP